MVLPVEHRRAPWDLSVQEWTATQTLLRDMKERVSEMYGPNGWNVGWNVGEVGGQSVDHAHCHLIPRYADELYAGRGLRWWFKQPQNAKPGG
jgi:diadenosine tetraphosphate (Ap4A) HIT family hydrolase